MDDQTKILKYLYSVEKLAQEIINDKQEIVMIDKRRNENREAVTNLIKSGQTKCWMTVGSILVKHNKETAITLLESDQKQLNIIINKLKSNLKIKLNDIRDLEMKPPIPGLKLVPMSNKEAHGLSSAGLFPK